MDKNNTCIRILSQFNLMFGNVVHPLVEKRNIIDDAQGAEEKREYVTVHRISTLQILFKTFICKMCFLFVHSGDNLSLHFLRWF